MSVPDAGAGSRVDDVAAAMGVCRDRGVPIKGRDGATSVVDQGGSAADRSADNVEGVAVATYDRGRFALPATSEGDIDRVIPAGGRRGRLRPELRHLLDRYVERIGGASSAAELESGVIRQRAAHQPAHAPGGGDHVRH